MQLSRKTLTERLNRTQAILGNGRALVLISPPEYVRNRGTRHRHRQHSFFHYLSGFNEPESALIINPELGADKAINIFLRPKDPVAEMWEGQRLGLEKAREELVVNQVHSIEDLWKKMPDLLKGAKEIFYEFGLDSRSDLELTSALKKLKDRTRNYSPTIHDPDQLAGALRVIKSAEEVELLEEAALITEKGFAEVLRILKPGINEHVVYGTLVGEFIKNGADMEAYSTIVAGGAHACTLHYTDNNALLNDGDLILIDAGAQYRYYASDVTRTFPVNGRYSPLQRDVYQIVLASQKNGINMARVGNSLKDVHQEVLRTLSEGLRNLGILKAGLDEILEKSLYKPYYPHSTSHWIGMDVHDVGVYKEGDELIDVPFVPGHYFSVEPGLYFSDQSPDVPPEFRGIGIRIEDDVLITEQGNNIITKNIPKTLSDIEETMNF